MGSGRSSSEGGGGSARGETNACRPGRRGEARAASRSLRGPPAPRRRRRTSATGDEPHVPQRRPHELLHVLGGHKKHRRARALGSDHLVDDAADAARRAPRRRSCRCQRSSDLREVLRRERVVETEREHQPRRRPPDVAARDLDLERERRHHLDADQGLVAPAARRPGDLDVVRLAPRPHPERHRFVVGNAPRARDSAAAARTHGPAVDRHDQVAHEELARGGQSSPVTPINAPLPCSSG